MILTCMPWQLVSVKRDTVCAPPYGPDVAVPKFCLVMVGLPLQCALGDDADALVTASKPAAPSARAEATPRRIARRTGACVKRIRMITPCLSWREPQLGCDIGPR